jgi:hypothetical protein
MTNAQVNQETTVENPLLDSVKATNALLENLDGATIGDDNENYDHIVEVVQEGLRVLNCSESDILDIILLPLNSVIVAEWASDHRVRVDTGDYQVINELFYDVRKLKNNPEKLLEHLDKWFNDVIDKTL